MTSSDYFNIVDDHEPSENNLLSSSYSKARKKSSKMTIPPERLAFLASKFEHHLGKGSLSGMRKERNKTNQINMVSGLVMKNETILLNSIRVAQEMTKRGYGVGDVATICGVNHDHITFPLIASFYIGVAVNPLAVEMSVVEIKHLVNLSKPKIAFCDKEVSLRLKQAYDELNMKVEIVVFGDDLPDPSFVKFEEFLKPTGTEEDFQASDFDPKKTIALIMCSSGTTGFPKGVCLTHSSVSCQINLPRMSVTTWVEEDEKFIIFSTLYWFSGILPVVLACSYNVVRIYSPKPYEPELAINAFIKYKPNICLLSPLSTMALLRHPRIDECDFSKIKAFVTTGSTIPMSELNDLKKRIPNGFVINSYGLTETTGGVCATPECKPNSCGQPFPWVQYKVVDLTTRKELGPMERGELLLKADLVMFKEYIGNPEDTKNSFEDGWLKTGDVVFYDEDGFIYIADRLKEMIKFRDMQVAPAQVEHEINKIPGVFASCVVGLPHPGDGARPMAFVELMPGAKVTAEEIKNHIKENLSFHRQLSGGVVFLEKLPVTPSGKVNRRVLNELKLTSKPE